MQSLKNYTTLFQTVKQVEVPESDPGALYNTILWLYPELHIHTRSVYTFIDLIGNLGGAFEVLYFFGYLFAYPIAKHLFVMEATEKMFKIKSKDESFQVDKDGNVQIRTLDSILLFFNNISFVPGCLWKNKVKLKRLFEKGEDMIQEKLDLMALA